MVVVLDSSAKFRSPFDGSERSFSFFLQKSSSERRPAWLTSSCMCYNSFCCDSRVFEPEWLAASELNRWEIKDRRKRLGVAQRRSAVGTPIQKGHFDYERFLSFSRVGIISELSIKWNRRTTRNETERDFYKKSRLVTV